MAHSKGRRTGDDLHARQRPRTQGHKTSQHPGWYCPHTSFVIIIIIMEHAENATQVHKERGSPVWHAKVADFGTCKRISPDDDQEHTCIGTNYFRAPGKPTLPLNNLIKTRKITDNNTTMQRSYPAAMISQWMCIALAKCCTQ